MKAITMENLMSIKMQADKVYSIENIKIIFHPKTNLYSKFYEVITPGLGSEQFNTKQKAITYIKVIIKVIRMQMMKDLQL